MNINLIILRCYMSTAPFFDEIMDSQEYDISIIGISYIRTVKAVIKDPYLPARDMLLTEERWFLYRRF